MYASTSPLRFIVEPSPFTSSSARRSSATVRSYRSACFCESGVETSISVLSGRSAMIDLSVLRRRRMNGRVSLRTTEKSFVLAVADWNDLRPPSSPGLMKSKMLQRSLILFSTGVPVSASRRGETTERSALLCPEPGFLIACASSAITAAKGSVRSFSERVNCP